MRSSMLTILFSSLLAVSCSRSGDSPVPSSTNEAPDTTECRQRDPALPTVLIGKVTSVTDGDSIIVQVARIMEIYDREDNTPQRGNASFSDPLEPPRTFMIDLMGIDAPELDQPWGKEAREALEKKVHGKSVMVSVPDIEPAEQTAGWVGVITSVKIMGVKEDYQTENVNFAMAKEGHVWHDVPTTADNQALAETEQEAREAGHGLWASAESIPPWDWREMHNGEAGE